MRNRTYDWRWRQLIVLLREGFRECLCIVECTILCSFRRGLKSKNVEIHHVILGIEKFVVGQDGDFSVWIGLVMFRNFA